MLPQSSELQRIKTECTVHRTVRGGFRRLYAVSEVRRRIKEVFMEIKHVCSLFLVVYPVYRDIKEKKICIIPALICVALGLIGRRSM